MCVFVHLRLLRNKILTIRERKRERKKIKQNDNKNIELVHITITIRERERERERMIETTESIQFIYEMTQLNRKLIKNKK